MKYEAIIMGASFGESDHSSKVRRIMKKIILALLLLAPVFTQGLERPVRDYSSKADQGWYWSNGFSGKYNYFGATFTTRLYYKQALFREKNSFWFADSHVSAGVEQELSAYTRTTAFLEFQPLIALNFMFKLTYEGALVEAGRPVLMDGENGSYNIALPPFTGLNPKTVRPVYTQGHTFILQFTPSQTIGGPLGPGMLAFFYMPTISFVKTSGVASGQYVYYVKDNVVMKETDVLFQHLFRLGYQIADTGVSIALDGELIHVASKGFGSIDRAGLFGALSYQKPVAKYPSLIPFFRMKMGTWLKDPYVQYHFTIFLDTGLIWKFN